MKKPSKKEVPRKAAKAKPAAKAKKPKAATAPQPNPQWKKVSDFVYEIVDPVTGGTWSYIANREMDEEQLYRAILQAIVFFGIKRPPKGTASILKSFS